MATKEQNIFNEIAKIFTIENDIKLKANPFKPGTGLFTIKSKEGKCIHPFSKSLQNVINKGGDSILENAYATYDDFLNSIQLITIREFSVEDKINYAASWFDQLGKGFEDAQKDGPGISLAALAEKAKEWVKDKKHGLMSLPQKIIDAAKKSIPFSTALPGDANDFLMILPFILYYRIATTTTTAIYEVPYSNPNLNSFAQSDGTYGWTQGSQDIVGRLLGKNAIGKFISDTFHVKCNVAPTFTPGGKADGSEIKIKFQLINDTAEAAVNNFLFVYMLLGKNKWIQYGFVQSSASLYDIRIPGGMRYMMCAGKFNCGIKGSLRRPSDSVLSGIQACTNEQFSKGITADRIAIPDGYDLDLLFKPLLPDNFNNFIYSFAVEKESGTGIMSEYRSAAVNGDTVKTEGVIGIISEEVKQSLLHLTDKRSALAKDVENAKAYLAELKKNGASSTDIDKAKDALKLAEKEQKEWEKNNPPPPEPKEESK